VKFATNSDRILPESDGILSAVSKIFDEHAEITKVSIEGHTDNRGAPAHNKRLSDKRAASVVKWLIKRGIAKTRLTSQGYGMSQPIDSNDTDEGRQAIGASSSTSSRSTGSRPTRARTRGEGVNR